MSQKAHAVVARAPLAERPGPNWSFEELVVQPIQDGEVLVEIVAVGICHTDVVLTSLPPGYAGIEYPRVAGHEGQLYSALETALEKQLITHRRGLCEACWEECVIRGSWRPCFALF